MSCNITNLGYPVIRCALLLFILFFIGFSANAQKGSNKTISQIPESEELSQQTFFFPEIKGFNGTYQFILKERRSISIHTNLLDHIENSRKQETDVILSISSFCDVLILSANKSKSTDFKPFETAF